MTKTTMHYDKIKNIIFDMGGVLVGLHAQRCIDAFMALGAKEIASYVEGHRTEDLFLDIELGRITTRDFCNEVRRLAHIAATDQQIVDAWDELTSVITDEKLARLRLLNRHYRVFLLSNTNEMHWLKHERDFLRDGHRVEDYFEHVFLSYEMQMKKPDTAIFQRVLDEARLQADETLFIDDSLENCQAAGQLGIHTLHETTGHDWMDMALPCVATIGMFDGVHRGHQHLLRRLLSDSRRTGLPAVVVTFDAPPRQVISGQPAPVLTTIEEKRQLLLSAGVDRVVVLPFDKPMSQMTARQFMQQVLHDQLGVRQLLMGYDNRFGSDRSPLMSDYVAIGRETGISVNCCDEADIKVSSSMIRQLLGEGRVDRAVTLLGRPYALQGRVVSGRQEGRRLGFPTANLSVDAAKLIPKPGVYATLTDGRPGMLNIGTRPTYDGTTQTIELHIFDTEENLYGQQLTTQLLWRVRNEQKFPSPADLQHQLAADREAIEQRYDEYLQIINKK